MIDGLYLLRRGRHVPGRFSRLPDHAAAARRPGLLYRDCAARAGRVAAARARGARQNRPGAGPMSGIKGWVTIGGYSALDTAKLSNVDHGVRGVRRLGQTSPGLLAGDADWPSCSRNFHAVRNGSVRGAAAVADSGLGQRVRLPDDGRRSRRGVGLREALRKESRRSCRPQRAKPGLSAHRLHHFQRRAVRSSTSISTARWSGRWAYRQLGLSDLADLPRFDLRQPL